MLQYKSLFEIPSVYSPKGYWLFSNSLKKTYILEADVDCNVDWGEHVHDFVCPQMLHDFLCPQTIHDFVCLQTVHNFVCLQTVHDFVCLQMAHDDMINTGMTFFGQSDCT